MKKGFTLVELLAIIAILAVVALIVTPIVTRVIDDSRKQTAIQSVKGYAEAANNAVILPTLDSHITVSEESHVYETGDEELSKIKIGGATPSYVYLNYSDDTKRVVVGRFCMNGYSIDYLEGNTSISKNNYCDGDYILEPGIYDKYDRLLASWDTLVNDYGMNINWYNDEGPIHRSGYTMFKEDDSWYYLDDKGEKQSAIHNVMLFYRQEGDGEYEAYNLDKNGWYYLTDDWEYIYVDVNEIESGAPVIVLQKNFPNTSKLILPSSITTIPIEAFDILNVDTVIVPTSVVKIEKWAFSNNDAGVNWIKNFEFESLNSWRCTATAHSYDDDGNELPLTSEVYTSEEFNEPIQFATFSFPNTLQFVSLAGYECVKITD